MKLGIVIFTFAGVTPVVAILYPLFGFLVAPLATMLALTYAGAISDLFSVKAMVGVSFIIESVALIIAIVNLRERNYHKTKKYAIHYETAAFDIINVAMPK